MKIVLLAFATFVLAGISLLPHIFSGISLMDSYPAFSAILIIIASILMQIQGLGVIRQQFRLNKMMSERDTLEDELQETMAKLHREKRATTDLRAQIVSQERQHRKGDAQSVEANEEIAHLKAERLNLELALAKSMEKIASLETLLNGRKDELEMTHSSRRNLDSRMEIL